MSKFGTTHVDAKLTNYSLKYYNGSLIADLVLPRLKVRHESDLYSIFGRQDQRLYSTKRANGAPANEILSLSISTASYACEEYALRDIVTQRDKDNADDDLNPSLDVTENLTAAIQLDRENRVATLCTTAGNYAVSGNTLTLVTTEQFNNASFDSDDPVDSIESRIDVGKEAIRRSTGMEPNHIIIPAAVAKVVKKDAAVRELIKYTQNDLLVNGDLPGTMWNMKVLIPGAVADSANLGQTFSGSDVWGKNIVMFYQAPSIALKTLTFGLSFAARERRVKRWEDDDRDGEVIQVDEIICEKMICEYAAYLLKEVIA